MKRAVTIIAIILLIVAGMAWLLVRRVPMHSPIAYGVTFSSFYAEQFGLDWQKTYTALFEDLGVRHLRLPAYWQEIEPEEGKFDFSRLDWQVAEAKKHGADVILAVGRKLPRWPECHEPVWAQTLLRGEKNKFHDALLKYIQTTIEHYRADNTVRVWQIENEPYLPFGDCQNYDSAMVDEEIKLVRSLDSTRSIMITDSGELSLWIRAASRADIFGSTMYRSVYNKIFGYITYPFKLEPGISHQHVAIDILRIEGFNSKILDDAYALVNAPH